MKSSAQPKKKSSTKASASRVQLAESAYDQLDFGAADNNYYQAASENFGAANNLSMSAQPQMMMQAQRLDDDLSAQQTQMSSANMQMRFRGDASMKK